MCACVPVCVCTRRYVCACLHVCVRRGGVCVVCVKVYVCDLCVSLSVYRCVCPYGNQSSSPQEEIHAWYCKLGQKPMAVGILDPEEMLLLFVLLNAYVTKLPSKYLSLFL